MKKMLMAVVLMFGVLIPALSLAATNGIVDGVRETFWGEQPDSYWFNQQCYEIKTGEIYSGTAGIFVDAFRNTTNKDLYILDAKVLTRGDYLKYNNTKYHNTDYDYTVRGLAILNEDLYNSDYDIKVKKGQTVIHMTTAEKISGATRDDYSLGWKFSNPHTLFGTTFNYGNYAPNGTHPEMATRFPNWDAEFRVVTVYSDDEMFSTPNDNHAIVECQRIVVRRCGDGILDTTREECDPGLAEWDSQTCNPVTCKKLPVCNSSYNGKPVDDLVEGDYLCNEGTVSNFNYDDSTHTWTWKCEAAGTGVECSAKKPYNGDLEMDKSLTGSDQLVTHTGQELLWQIKVTAKGGDKKDVKIKDYLPKVLTYKSTDSILPSGVTMPTTIPTAGKDSTGDYLQWNTEGTLYSGQSIILIVKTTVDIMPASGDNYRNVACAWTNPDDEDCDPEPVKTEGFLHINKTLTGKLTVESTGQILIWNVKVTALSGDVENFEIWDIMPNKLEYVTGYLIGNNHGIKITKKSNTSSSGDDNTVHYRDAKGILQEGDSITMAVETKVKEMPTSGENILNVACAIKNEETQDCDPAETENPKIWIKKYILTGNQEVKTRIVKIGDEITYKIYFGNSGNAVAKVSVKDFLPKNVKYKSAEIYLNGKKYDGTADTSNRGLGEQEIRKGFKVSNGIELIIYGGLNLQPGDEGYIILTGTVLAEYQTYSKTNWACIYLNDENVDCDNATYFIEESRVLCSSGDFKITTTSFSYTGGSTEVSCGTDPKGANAKIEIDCGSGSTGNRYITGSNISSLTGVCKYPENTSATAAKYEVQCKVNDVVSSGCAGNVSVNSKTTPKVSCIPTLNGSYVNPVCEDDKSTFSTTATCRSTSSADIQILCDGTVVKTGHTTELTGTCSANTNNTGHRVQCMVNGSLTGSDGKACEATFSRSTKPCGGPSSTSHCKAPKHNNGTFTCESDGNAYAVGIECNSNLNKSPQIIKSEEIKDGKMKPLTVSAECSTNNTVTCYIKKSSNSEWETEPSCKWSPIGPGPGPDPDTEDYCIRHPNAAGCELGDPHCFNINAGNFSIESGEYLPFYFNIYRESQDKKEKKYRYKFVRGRDENKCDLGTIDLSSMKCNYLIENPDGNVVYSSGGINCMEDKTEIKKPSLINSWIKQQEKDYYINVLDIGPGKYRPHIEYTDSSKWNTNDVLGEYKFKVELREYEWCAADDNGNGKWETVKIPHKDAAVCQSNFVLTDSYTVQKTPSGNLTASTDTLSKFKEADGKKMSFSNYLNAIAASDYKPNTKVNGAMEAFINKYKKLAVNVDIENSKFLESKVSVSKVPGKHIYFVNGNITIKGGSKNIETPFTIVQTSGETTVKGDINHNMMLLTRGDIKFEGSCTGNQNVKGIFYASGNLIRGGVDKNNNLKNAVRCTKGGLHIKGVLIGNNFNELMSGSRSHLENWFKTEDKKLEIMNGASVLIEYSPSIFNKSTMPPGAEDFTTALSIYKQ